MFAKKSPDVVEDPLVDALSRTAFATMSVLTRVSAAHDMSLTQLRVLAVLRNRRLRMSALAEHLGLEKSTMSGLVSRAEQRGLLARGPSESDGRSVEAFLTPAGAELAAQVGDEVRRLLPPTTDLLTAAERATLVRLLERLLPDDPDGARGV